VSVIGVGFDIRDDLADMSDAYEVCSCLMEAGLGYDLGWRCSDAWRI
jgi:hypothetical protein